MYMVLLFLVAMRGGVAYNGGMMLLLEPAQNLLPEMPWALPLFFALFGACIGSFLNVVIYRVPRGLSVNEPRRSFCPTCKAPIPWYLNLPVLSWLMLRGRSACCRTPIAVRYWLVEVLCAVLWAGLAAVFAAESLVVITALCVWAALMLACFCIDWEQMVVLPSLTVGAALCGLLTAGLSPWLMEEGALELWEGVQVSLLGAAGGFALFKLVGLCGKYVFGRRRKQFDAPQPWRVAQAADGEDIELLVGEETLLWSELFFEPSNRIVLTAATEANHVSEPAELRFTPEAMLTAAGERVSLESVESLSGTCGGYACTREAMGSGDAWLALAIGALCGWSGVLFALVGGSFIGLGMAAVNRIGFGKPMPFGPALIAAAVIWLFFGEDLRHLYFSLWGLE